MPTAGNTPNRSITSWRAGLPPGDYDMNDGRRFTTRDGVARTVTDGTLVGSVLTMNRAFGNLVEECGLDPVLAARYTSTNAARAMGARKGRKKWLGCNRFDARTKCGRGSVWNGEAEGLSHGAVAGLMSRATA